jgi:pimeloyl-ACP methyl ester carboxylesterase
MRAEGVVIVRSRPATSSRRLRTPSPSSRQSCPQLGDGLTREDAERVTQPVMAVLGGESDTVSAVFRERPELLLSLLPHADSFVLPEATHLLYVQDSQGMASGLVEFFGRHPIPSPA